MSSTKPRVFIASSTEGVTVAYKLQDLLQQIAVPQVWKQDTFPPGKFFLQGLLESLDNSDFGLFVLTPDDDAVVKGERKKLPRDNVVLELGMFLSRLGPEHCFVVAPKTGELRRPTDLFGLSVLEYDLPTKDNPLGTTLGPVATKIGEAIQSALSADRHPTNWIFKFPGYYPLRMAFPIADREPGRQLIEEVANCSKQFLSFGLTRNFLASAQMLRTIEQKAREIPITLFMMDPDEEVRKHRYMIEPIEASCRDPGHYRIEILLRFQQVIEKLGQVTKKPEAGLKVLFYNFPCSFALEWIDNSIRVMPYGHNKRGTEGPIFVFRDKNPYFDYFREQAEWLLELSQGVNEPYRSKGIKIRSLAEVLRPSMSKMKSAPRARFNKARKSS